MLSDTLLPGLTKGTQTVDGGECYILIHTNRINELGLLCTAMCTASERTVTKDSRANSHFGSFCYINARVTARLPILLNDSPSAFKVSRTERKTLIIFRFELWNEFFFKLSR